MFRAAEPLGSRIGAAAVGARRAGAGDVVRGVRLHQGPARRRAYHARSGLEHAAEINGATPLPVSADLEDGYGSAAETVAETVRLAVEAGLAGCSIEDTDLQEPSRSYAFDHAVERIGAAVDAARGAGRPFVLTARADGILTGAYDVDEAVRRLQAFESAGADCLYAPSAPDLEAQTRICAAVSKPVNALAAGPLLKASLAAIAQTGARRVSLGSTLARKTHAAIVDASKALINEGSFVGMRGGAKGADIDAMLSDGALEQGS